MRMLRAGGVYEFIQSGLKWMELIEAETNEPNGLTKTKTDRIDQLRLNITKVDRMDQIGLKWS